LTASAARSTADIHPGPVGRYSQLDYEAEIHAWTLACFG
jgi:hypothetical protein